MIPLRQRFRQSFGFPHYETGFFHMAGNIAY
jgi:hypothetical protein